MKNFSALFVTKNVFIFLSISEEIIKTVLLAKLVVFAKKKLELISGSTELNVLTVHTVIMRILEKIAC